MTYKKKDTIALKYKYNVNKIKMLEGFIEGLKRLEEIYNKKEYGTISVDVFNTIIRDIESFVEQEIDNYSRETYGAGDEVYLYGRKYRVVRPENNPHISDRDTIEFGPL